MKLEDILTSVDELAARGKISQSRALGAWYAINFYDLDEDEALESAAADGGNDQGIDVVFADSASEEIVVLQAHCPQNRDKKTPKEKWDALIASLPFVRDPSQLKKSGRPDLAESIANLWAQNPGYAVTAGLISLGLKSDAIDRSLQAHNEASSNKGTTFFYLPQEDLISRYQTLVEAEVGIPEDKFTFAGGCFADSGDYGRAWVGSVAASELRRLHDQYGNALFAGNIRLFLGNRKGGINDQIIKTAQTSPGNFWALNNGITIVADTVEPDKKNSSVLKLRRFSIVNGCQTTSSLVRADPKATAKVMARVIAAKTGLRNEIVRYNNSQNAVRIWTVRAADDVQEQLRRDLAKVNFTYAPKQSGSRRKRDASIIELDKVTQYLASSELSYLIQAINNKSELFDEPYQRLFKRGIKAPAVLLAWLVGGIADFERGSLIDELVDDANAPLLGVTSSYWIIYCTYKILHKFSDLDSPNITLERMNTQEFENALRKYVKKAVGMFYDAAVDTYDRDEYGSFTSTLRSNKFLQKLDSKLNIRITKLTAKELPDLASVAKSAKSAKPPRSSKR